MSTHFKKIKTKKNKNFKVECFFLFDDTSVDTAIRCVAETILQRVLSQQRGVDPLLVVDITRHHQGNGNHAILLLSGDTVTIPVGDRMGFAVS